MIIRDELKSDSIGKQYSQRSIHPRGSFDHETNGNSNPPTIRDQTIRKVVLKRAISKVNKRNRLGNYPSHEAVSRFPSKSFPYRDSEISRSRAQQRCNLIKPAKRFDIEAY